MCHLLKIQKGFTLIELLLAVAIIGIVSSIAVPSYNGYISSSRATNAKNNLLAIYMKQQEYYTNNNAYYSTGATCGNNASLINTNIFSGQTIISDSYYTYCITQTATTNFTARATLTSNAATFYTIDYNNVKNF